MSTNLRLLLLSGSCMVLTACQLTPSGASLSNSSVTLSKPLTSQIFGDFHGKIESSGILNPSVTSFTSNKEGLTGHYYFIEDNNKVSGTLTKCQTPEKYKLQCQWQDKYGSGDLQMIFNQSYDAFEGKWSFQGYFYSKWSGQK